MADTLHLAEGIDVLAPEDGDRLRYNAAEAQLVIDFIETLCFGQNKWAGKPFVLADWQKNDVIRPFYGVQVEDETGEWVRYRRFLYLEIPKKNGKSELAAALALYHLLMDGEKDPKVGVFAADKENAGIIYGAAQYMVEHTYLGEPEEDGLPPCYCRPSVREIRTKYGGILKVYSSEAQSKHGYSLSCVIVDELHAQAKRDLWDVLTEGSDSARSQQVVLTLTTAGHDPDHSTIGWEIHEQCRRLLAFRRGEPERELDEDDPQWLPVMYGLSTITQDDPEKLAALNIWDPALWARCNPSYGISISPRKFRMDAKAAKQSEIKERNFRWLRLNQWISVQAVGWIPLTIYDKTQWHGDVYDLRGLRCYGGLDLSTTTDLTAFVLLFPPQEGLDSWVMLPHAWRPKATVTDAEQRDHVPYQDWARAGFITLSAGDQVDYTDVEDAVWQAAKQYNLHMLGVDPYLSQVLTQHFMTGDKQHHRAPISVVEIAQTMMSMSPACKELERLMRDHQMLHVHNTASRWCFGNVRMAVDGNENIKPMKNRSTGRIDITVAWIIAMAAAIAGEANLKDTINKHVMGADWSM